MKPTGTQLKAFLANPPPGVRAILVFGSDEGLIRERAGALTTTVCEDPKDPFRVSEFAASVLRDEPAQLADEAAAISMTGGRRVVRVRDASDTASAVFKTLLADPPGDSLIIVEAGELGPRSSLRRLFEGADNAAAIACYRDSARDLESLIRETLGARNISLDPEALSYLQLHLGADRLVTRAELEKVTLYVGDGNPASLADVAACVGDSSALTIEDALNAAGLGEIAHLDRALELAFAAGASPVGVLRIAANHFRRLHLTAARVAAGAAINAALANLRPPVFFKYRDGFREAVRRWPAPAGARALEVLVEAEQACKRAGMPEHAICRDALVRISVEAASRSPP